MISPSKYRGKVISCRINSKFGLSNKWVMFSFLPEKKLSTQIISCLFFRSWSQRLDPINPAPPVTIILFPSILWFFKATSNQWIVEHKVIKESIWNDLLGSLMISKKLVVEAAGFEPASKAGTHLVSTCLVWLLCLALKKVTDSLHLEPVRQVLIPVARTSTRTSPSKWRSILIRQATIRRNGLHDIKRKLRCRSWHLCCFQDDSAGNLGPAHATRRFSCSVEANRPPLSMNRVKIYEKAGDKKKR